MDHEVSSVYTVPFWEKTWRTLGQSFLADHQKRYPERWHQFYETKGPWMRKISGQNKGQADHIVEILIAQELLLPEGSAIDLGCGNGWLALPMASKGIRVIAVDTSAAMLTELKHSARKLKDRVIETRHSCWKELKLEQPFDLALAACFPPVLSPDGIMGMERLGKKCALLLPGNDPGPPWTRNLWSTLFDKNPYSGSRQLQTATNYLISAHKNPGLIPVKVPYSVDISFNRILDFYMAYFSMFDKSGPEIREKIEKELLVFACNGRVTAKGEINYGLIWWNTST